MPRMSLRTKLQVGVLLVLVPVLGLLLTGYQVEQARQRTEVLDRLTQTAQTVALVADATFDEAIAVGWAMASEPAVQSLDPALVEPHLRRLAPRYSQYENLRVLDARGDLVAQSAEAPPDAARNFADRPYFQRAMLTGQPTVVEVVLSRRTGRPIAGAAVPMPGADERPLGTVGVGFDLANLEARLASVGLQPGQAIGLIDPEGRVALLTARPDLTWEERDHSQMAEVQAALAGRSVQTADFSSPLLGDTRAAAFVSTPKYGWVVSVTWPTAQAFGPLEAAFRLQLLTFGAIALLSLLGTALLGVFIVRPVAQLATQAEALGRGDLARRADIRTGDELEALGRAFNAMAGQLQGLLRQLEQARDEAEAQRDEADTERARLRAILESSAHGILFIEAETGRVIANPRAIQALGQLVPEAGPAQHLGRVCDAEGRALPLEELPSSRALQGETMHDDELLLVRTDGGRMPVLTSAAPVRDAQRKVTGAVVAFQDISALKALERLREEWTLVIAHDLRQPVTVISGYASLLARLAERHAAPPQEKTATDHILASTRRLERMIADLLDASRIEAGRLKLERQLVDVPGLVGEVVERTAEVTRGHPVQVNVTGDVPLVEADPGRIEQVLTNLLSNAAKYADPESEIRVEVQVQGGGVEVAVANQGPGIPPEELPQLFSRFYRTHQVRNGRVVPGLGLGLYICKGLVEAQGGRIWAESIPGQTTTFRVSLPLPSGDGGPMSARSSNARMDR